MKNYKNRRLISLSLIFIVLIVSAVLIVFTRAPSGHVSIKAVSDGSGGVIVAWCKKHSIHVQHISPDGIPLWDRDDVLSGVKIEQPSQFDLVSDGLGGVVIIWGDVYGLTDDFNDPAYFSPAPVYGQRLDSTGKPLWHENVELGYAEHHGTVLSLPEIISSGDGGIIVVWDNYKVAYRALKDDNYRIQKISTEGEKIWGNNGVSVCSSDPFRIVTPAEKVQGIPGTWIRSGRECGNVYIVSDGAGGAIVAWSVYENESSAQIYAQRYYANGGKSWKEDGILIGNGKDMYLHSIVSDGEGGAIVLMNSGLYTIQKIDSNGGLRWPGNGIQVKNGVSIIADDGSGGFNYIWIEVLPPYGYGAVFSGQNVLYAQRINGYGDMVWPDEPLFTGEKGYMLDATLIDVGSEGVFIAWQTWEQGHWDKKVFIQKVNTDGKPVWDKNGKAIFPASFRYQGSPVLVEDNNGGVIVLAIVGKSPINGDIVYAQRADALGNFLWVDGVIVSHGRGGQ